MFEITEQAWSPWYDAPWWNSIAAMGTLISAVVAAWAVRAAVRSAKAAETAAEITRDAAMSANLAIRAYVTIASAQGSEKLIPRVPVNVIFTFKNVGQTPAFHVRFGAGFYLDTDVPTEDELDGMLNHFSPLGPITPDVLIPITCGSNESNEQFAAKEETITKLKAGQQQAVMFLKLLYEDVFGVQHVTRVAFHYDRFVDGFRFAPYYNSMK